MTEAEAVIKRDQLDVRSVEIDKKLVILDRELTEINIIKSINSGELYTLTEEDNDSSDYYNHYKC